MAPYWGPGDPVPGAHFQGEEVQPLLLLSFNTLDFLRFVFRSFIDF